MRVHLFVVVSVLMISGCVKRADLQWTRPNTDEPTYRMDAAKCKMYSNEVGRSKKPILDETSAIRVSSSVNYNSDTGYYSQESRIFRERSPFAPAINSISKSNAEYEAYLLCMQSLGYRYRSYQEVETVSKKNIPTIFDEPTMKGKTGDDCKDNFDCRIEFYCFSGACIPK